MMTAFDTCPVTALVLTHNEQHAIQRCLRSVAWAGEIVVIDDYSTDQTVEICRQLGAKVFQRHYDYYGAQSQWGLQHCSYPWVYQLDADEECTLELGEEIVRVTNNRPQHDAFLIPMRPIFLGKEICHGSWGGKKRVRLFQKAGAKYGGPKNHEGLQNIQNLGKLRGAYLHHTYNTMHEWVKKQLWYARFGCETVYEKGHKPSYWNLLLRPPWRFFDSYIRRLGFLDGKHGLMIAGFEAVTIFLRYCYLYEMMGQDNPNDYKPSQWKE